MFSKVKELIEKNGIPALYELDGKDPATVNIPLRFEDLFSDWEWYAWEAEIDEENKNILFFGYVNGHEKEMGYFTLEQFMDVNKKGFPRILPDYDFETITLKELKDKWNIPYRPYPIQEENQD